MTQKGMNPDVLHVVLVETLGHGEHVDLVNNGVTTVRAYRREQLELECAKQALHAEFEIDSVGLA